MPHVDVKKLGNIPDGCGRRYVGRSQGERNREATARRTTIERVLNDNGSALQIPRLARRMRRTRHPAEEDPYRPRRTARSERFHRTLADGRALGRFHSTEQGRRKTLPAWLHHYKHRPPHTATDGKPPITGLTNVPAHAALAVPTLGRAALGMAPPAA
jgi:transposase InsO family protein